MSNDNGATTKSGNGNAPEIPVNRLPAVPQREPIREEVLFNLDQRKAAIFAKSPLVPEHLKGKSVEEAIANCYIAMTMARELKQNPIVVMQNIYVVHGRAGWNAAYIIAQANRSGKFIGSIGWRMKDNGKRQAVRKIKTGWDAAAKKPIFKDEKITVRDLEATAFAKLKETGEEVSFPVDMAMAEAENWIANDKYLTMPELMLRYRSATLLVRLYCPEVMLGYQTDVEMETLPMVRAESVTVTPTVVTPPPDLEQPIIDADSRPTTDAEVVGPGGELFRSEAEANAYAAQS